MSDNEITFEDVAGKFTDFAARKIASQYSRYLVTFEDCVSEIKVWLYSQKGQKNVERWLAKGQHSRIRFQLQDLARAYAEKMKAEKVGYDPDDVHWYSASQVLALLPLALDDTYDGTGPLDFERADDIGPKAKKDPSTGGEILAMVMDVRSAVSRLEGWVADSLVKHQPGDSLYDSAVEAVVQYLGGPRPFVGRRRPMSNAEAQAQTGDI